MVSNTSTLTLMYSGFPGRFGSLPGLASELYSTISTLKGTCVKEKGGCFGSQRAHLRTHFY